MKKLLAISMLLLSLYGCGSTTTEPSAEHTAYFQSGRYYFTADLQGQVLTNDGNIWDYTQDIISEEPSYHNEPVIAVIDDNGTPDTVEDDAILGLVLDRETAIYDALEASLSESFELERDGNNIRIQSIKAEK
jgi:hypothetical protein